ncbi:hypothetical protein NLJ89_g9479 [Agrocybe chaxingu]|uniref:MAS20-domain-containing protein n=1 Tax=Agrocybe chaxingu TaxID=84603 RepID=A0A9W8JSD1_9AGAR|nr:hypothetical protein NLJ89_g9479 [Agrocybe chaxingu]
MDSGRSTTTFITVAAVTVAVGLAAYAVYFDYRRRNDTEFQKEKKRVQKSVAQNKESEVSASTSGITPAALREALQQVKNEETPKTPEEKETYFMAQVGLGEQLAAQGPTYYLPAAMAFYRALRVYPSPVELIVIYQKTIPEPVFKLVMDMTNLDVSIRIEAYYDFFPPKRTNVSIVMREATAGQAARHVLVVNKDFAAGEVIYKEFPVVAALDSDLQSKGTYCGQCLRPIEPEMSLSIKDVSTSSFCQTYCSKACLLVAKKSHNILFTLDSPLPPEIPSQPPRPEQLEARKEAQAKFAAYLKKEGRSVPLLVARFIARQVGIETEKLIEATNPGAKGTTSAEQDFTDSDNIIDGYSLTDHIERFRYLEAKPNTEEKTLLADVLNLALPGLEAFVTEEKHTVLAGKMSYNVFGVCYGGGRDDKVCILDPAAAISNQPNLL